MGELPLKKGKGRDQENTGWDYGRRAIQKRGEAEE